jgi:predicted kinase
LQPQPGDALIRQASELFFRVLRLLVEGGVSTVAEAAFQHQIWVKSLEPLQMLAQVRVVDCHVDPSVARHRILSRPPRSAHADVQLVAALEAGDAYLEDFERLRLGVPSIKVDTSTDYRPTIDAVASFVRGG